MTDLLILANDGMLLANEGVDLLDTEAGGTIRTLLRALGTAVVLLASVMIVKSVIGGRVAVAVKTLLGTIVIAAFLFNPDLFNTLINTFSGLVSTFVESFGELLGGDENGG